VREVDAEERIVEGRRFRHDQRGIRTLCDPLVPDCVAVESGKSKRARFRWSCDRRLRRAIATMADTSRHHNPWPADLSDVGLGDCAGTGTPPQAVLEVLVGWRGHPARLTTTDFVSV
jgi:hypothetical protein